MEKRINTTFIWFNIVSILILLMGFIIYIVSKDVQNPRLLTHSAVNILNIGVWGKVFMDLMNKRNKK